MVEGPSGAVVDSLAADIVRYRFHLRRFNAALRRPLSE
jgi:hypothetical protein